MLKRTITSVCVAVLCTLWGCNQHEVHDPKMPLCLYSGGVSLQVKEIRVRTKSRNTLVTVVLANACTMDVSLPVGILQMIVESIVVKADDETLFRVGPVPVETIMTQYSDDKVLISSGQAITTQVIVYDGPILSMQSDSKVTPRIQMNPEWTLRVLKTGREYDVPLHSTGNTGLVFE